MPPNPTQLIASPRMGELLAYLKSEFSCIILDTPPLGILADGFSLSEYADACVYVVRANVLDKKGLRVVADLEKGGAFGELGNRGERDQGQSFRWLRLWLWLRVRLRVWLWLRAGWQG